MRRIVPLLAGPALALALLPIAAGAEPPVLGGLPLSDGHPEHMPHAAALAARPDLASCAGSDGLPHDWAIPDLGEQEVCLAHRFRAATRTEAGRWLAAQGFRLADRTDLPAGHAGFTARFHTDLMDGDGPVLIPFLLTAILHAAVPPIAIHAEWDGAGAFRDVRIAWEG